MNDQVQEQSVGSTADTVKLAAAALLLIAGIAGYYLLAGRGDWLRWLGVIIGVALAVVVFASSRQGRNVWQFVLDSRIELRKVVWPTKQETMTTTAIVFGFVIIAGLFFWSLDLILAWATRFLTGQGS
jgi:preprotein translocase subunit SecE